MADALQQLLDIEAIKQLKARYFRYVDTKDWQAFADEVVTDDVRFDIVGHVVEGRDVAVPFIAGTLEGGRSVHHGHSPEIRITGPDTATGVWAMFDYVTLRRKNGTWRKLVGYGHYHEEYVRTQDGWRIRSTALTRLRTDTEVVAEP
jgi:hypothetical protein